jgi:hypothetical protein
MELEDGLKWDLSSRGFRNAFRDGDASAREAVSDAVYQALERLEDAFDFQANVGGSDELEEAITDRITESLEDTSADLEADKEAAADALVEAASEAAAELVA